MLSGFHSLLLIAIGAYRAADFVDNQTNRQIAHCFGDIARAFLGKLRLWRR
jgi:hypothetical protein